MRKLKTNVWPYTIAIQSNNFSPDQWCSDNVGRRFADWYSYDDSRRKRVYAFKDEATLLVFKLKWGYNV